MVRFLDRSGEIGGERTPVIYGLVYLFGVVVGSLVRIAAFFLPSSAIEWLRARLLPA